MTYLEIKNDKLKGILESREIVFNDIQKINEEIIKLDAERKKHALKMERLKDKTRAIIDKINFSLGEFETISRVFLENGVIKVEIVDEVEEFKKYKRENAENK